MIALLTHQGMGGETAQLLGRNVGATYNALIEELAKTEEVAEPVTARDKR